MESRWYLFQGQTLENTKISDRAHALHITGEKWNDIVRHLDRKKIIQEALDKEEALKKSLKEGSEAMTKNWENSVQNIRLRAEGERERLLELKKDTRIQKYFEIKKEQEKVRQQYVDKVRKQMFVESGHAKNLTSALITSEMLYERQKQVEFKDMIKEHEKKEKNRYADVIKKNAEDEVKEKAVQRLEDKEKNKKYGKMLIQQIEANALAIKNEQMRHRRQEQIDNLRAAAEMDAMAKIQQEEKIKKRNEAFVEKKKCLDAIESRKKLLEQEEKELDEVILIYKNAKERLDCLRKQKEKELKEAVFAKRDAIAVNLGQTAKAKDEIEEAALEKIVAEKEAEIEEKAKEKEGYRKKMIEELVNDRNQFLKHKMEQKQREIELEKWHLLNRVKANESMKVYEEKKMKKEWQDVLAYRNALLDQMEVNKKEREREKLIDQSTYDATFEEDDQKFFEYADEVLDEAKKKGRATFPIEKVIIEYQKENNLTSPFADKDNCDNAEVKNKGKDSQAKNIVAEYNLAKSAKTRNCRCINKK